MGASLSNAFEYQEGRATDANIENEDVDVRKPSYVVPYWVNMAPSQVVRLMDAHVVQGVPFQLSAGGASRNAEATTKHISIVDSYATIHRTSVKGNYAGDRNSNLEFRYDALYPMEVAIGWYVTTTEYHVSRYTDAVMRPLVAVRQTKKKLLGRYVLPAGFNRVFRSERRKSEPLDTKPNTGSGAGAAAGKRGASVAAKMSSSSSSSVRATALAASSTLSPPHLSPQSSGSAAVSEQRVATPSDYRDMWQQFVEPSRTFAEPGMNSNSDCDSDGSCGSELDRAVNESSEASSSLDGQAVAGPNSPAAKQNLRATSGHTARKTKHTRKQEPLMQMLELYISVKPVLQWVARDRKQQLLQREQERETDKDQDLDASALESSAHQSTHSVNGAFTENHSFISTTSNGNKNNSVSPAIGSEAGKKTNSAEGSSKVNDSGVTRDGASAHRGDTSANGDKETTASRTAGSVFVAKEVNLFHVASTLTKEVVVPSTNDSSTNESSSGADEAIAENLWKTLTFRQTSFTVEVCDDLAAAVAQAEDKRLGRTGNSPRVKMKRKKFACAELYGVCHGEPSNESDLPVISRSLARFHKTKDDNNSGSSSSSSSPANDVNVEDSGSSNDVSISHNSVIISNEDANDSTDCAICLMEPREFACLPCRHLSVCAGCIDSLVSHGNKCPICRMNTELFLRVPIKLYNPSADRKSGSDDEEVVEGTLL